MSRSARGSLERDPTTDRSIDPVDELTFSQKTGKRAVYEAFDFQRVSDVVRVSNESYADPDEHAYTVDLDARGVPERCTCPAFEWHTAPGEACKHMLAVALHHAHIVDRAVATDGGQIVDAGDDAEILSDERPENCKCWDPEVPIPCWECYLAGFREQNPEAPAAEDGDV